MLRMEGRLLRSILDQALLRQTNNDCIGFFRKSDY
jgi:hypothetical protein